MATRWPSGWGAAVACSLALTAANLQAQPEDQAAARALFDEGKALIAAQKVAEACPKFEAASQLYSSPGILLNLADCYEKTGRTASAWTRFGEAATVAARSGRTDDADEAKRRQTALAPNLSRLAVNVPKPVAGITVTRDHVPLAAAAWGVGIPVDPGDHEVRVDAPGYVGWSGKVTVSEAGKTVALEVPELALREAAPPAPSPGPAPSTEPNTTTTTTPAADAGSSGEPAPDGGSGGGVQATLGLVAGGLGIVGMGVGGFLGLGAKSTFDDAKDATGQERNQGSKDAVSQAGTATIVFAIGGALTVTGVVLWLTAPSSAPSESSARAVAERRPAHALGPRVGVTTTGTSVLVTGSF